MTAAVRTWRKTKTEKDTRRVKAVLNKQSNLKKALAFRLMVFSPCGEKIPQTVQKAVVKVSKRLKHNIFSSLDEGLIVKLNCYR